jgi:hypothetical protein
MTTKSEEPRSGNSGHNQGSIDNNKPIMSAEELQALMDRCETFHPDPDLTSVCLKAVQDGKISERKIPSLVDSGYVVLTSDGFKPTEEAKFHLCALYPNEMADVIASIRRRAEEEESRKQARESAEWWRSCAANWLEEGMLVIDDDGRYRITEAGKDRAGHWMRYSLTHTRRQYEFGPIGLDIISLDGLKVGEERKAKTFSWHKWPQMMKRIRKSLTPAEMEELGMSGKGAPGLTEEELVIKELALRPRPRWEARHE